MKVSEANLLIKNNIESIIELANLSIEGEITSVKEYPTAIYFDIVEIIENNTIKSSIRAIYWKNFNRTLNANDQNIINIKAGNKICAKGKIKVYERNGTYNLNVYKVNMAGDGERLLALQNLKKKLEKEGIFKHKREINLFPDAIGVITGKDSAALSDIITNINRRYPTTIYVFPTIVQGEKAINSLINSLRKAYKYNLDTIIIGRGGGSIDDLDAFNDETVARVAFESPFPIVSAVGHEINKSIIDYVADKYASTPTAAAELTTKDKIDIFRFLNENYETIKNLFQNRIMFLRKELENYSNCFSIKNIKNSIENKLKTIETYKVKLLKSKEIFFNNKKNILKLREEQLSSLNIEKIFKKGFVIVKNKNGEIIKSNNKIKIHDILKINFYNNGIEVEVIKKD